MWHYLLLTLNVGIVFHIWNWDFQVWQDIFVRIMTIIVITVHYSLWVKLISHWEKLCNSLDCFLKISWLGLFCWLQRWLLKILPGVHTHSNTESYIHILVLSWSNRQNRQTFSYFVLLCYCWLHSALHPLELQDILLDVSALQAQLLHRVLIWILWFQLHC